MLERPEQEYRKRFEQRQAEIAAITDLHPKLWIGFTIALVCLCATLYFSYFQGAIPVFWCALPAAAAIALNWSLHESSRRFSRVQRIADFYELGLARLSGTWQGRGVSGDQFKPEKHIYADDLHLFGKGSLFELLCTARSGMGRATLARWLLAPASPQEVRARQEAVAELRERLDIHEECAALASPSLKDVSEANLREWVEAEDISAPAWMRVAAVLLPIVFVLLAVLAFAKHVVPTWTPLIPVAFEVPLALYLRRQVRETMETVRAPYELALLGPLIDRFGRERFSSPLLQSLQKGFACAGARPLQRIRILRVLCWLLSLRNDEWFALFFSPLLWATNLALLIDRWRRTHRRLLPSWMDSVGQFEALLCLARYAYENPEHTLPAVVDSRVALFHAERFGHPLLSASVCVRCDLNLSGDSCQLVMVSGSNMAGKSTLLRSVGVNSVLALAGSVVRAERLEISALAVACSISVHDSLVDGKSRFMAEVERLQQIIRTAETSPALFLLDEVLGGTNSNDRYFGTKAIIDRLVGFEAVGLVTSHDLALAEVATALGVRAENVHLEEQYENGEMRFDYEMRPGILTRTNGLKIMAALGVLEKSREAGN